MSSTAHPSNDSNAECFSYDEIGTWRVEALKEYLRRRDLRVSGRKEELVARVFAAAEQNLPVCMDADARVVQTQREKESLLTTPEGILPDPSTLQNGWVGERNGMTEWPPILLSDITLYIMKDHPGNDISLQKRLLNEYKEGKAYRLYSAGWLKEIYMHPVNDSCNYCFLKANFTPSMKISNVPHTVWICARKKSGEVHSAFCTCTAG